MFRFLFLTTALAGIAGSAYANGSYSHAGGVHVDGSVTYGAQPTLGSVYEAAPTYGTLGGQYEVAPTVATHGAAVHTGGVNTGVTYAPAQSTTQTYSIMPGNSQTYTVPAGQDATYNIVVPTAAPAPVYAPQPEAVYAPQPVAAGGWAARGVYFGARAGLTSTDDTKFTIAPLKKGPSNTVRTAYDEPGYTGSVVVGYGARQPHGWGYRMELEAGYQSASVDTHTISGIGKFGGNDAKGDAKTLYGFANVYGDVPITDRLSLTAGGGVGIGKVKFEDYGVKGAGKALDDSATAFGYHLDAGMSYQVSEQVALEALYRYQTFVDAEVRTENGNDTKIDLTNHSVLAGVRVGF